MASVHEILGTTTSETFCLTKSQPLIVFWSLSSHNGNFVSHVSTPGANIIHEITTVTNKTKAYINLARPELPQLDGHIAQVVETHVPVKQQAMLLILRIPPMLKLNFLPSSFVVQNFLCFQIA